MKSKQVKNRPDNSVNQGSQRFAMIPQTVLCSARYRALSKCQSRIYTALALHANKARECCPGMETLANLAGVHKRTVEEAIPRLVELGLLVIKQSGGGRCNTNKYRLVDDPDGHNPGDTTAVSIDTNPGQSTGVSAENPGENTPKPRSPHRGNIEQMTCHGDTGSTRVDANRCALFSAGVAGPNLERLAVIEDLNADDINQLAGIARDKAARNPAGLLVSMIDQGRRPSSSPPAEAKEVVDATKPSRPEEVDELFAAYTADFGNEQGNI